MIPVKQEPEPDIFDQLVRIPGKKFLKKLSNAKPTYKQWKNQDYWKHIRFHLHDVYSGICAYSAHWIPRSSNPNVDHFIPKSVKPELAYEWSNYRLACPLVNTLKKDYQDVLDPFIIENNWFFLDFPSLMMKVNPELPEKIREKVKCTIDRLKLNENEAFVNDRSSWLKRFCLGEASFAQLKRDAPFIAYELERQNLVESIKAIMAYVSEEEDE